MSRSVRQAYPFRNIGNAEVKITPPEEKIVFKVGEGVVIEEVKPLEIKTKVEDSWPTDGYPHERDEHGTCRNCGASKNEYHYKLLRGLREINMQNLRGPKSNNKSGYLGVRWVADCNKWKASITANKQYHFLGMFTNIDDAIAARRQGELKYFQHRGMVAAS